MRTRALAKWTEESMGLRVDSGLLYKSSSKAKVIKMSKHARSDVRAEREKKVQLYTTRKRFKISRTSAVTPTKMSVKGE